MPRLLKLDLDTDALGPNEGARLKALLKARAARRKEALAIYQPMPMQQKLHESMARRRLAVGSNQSGKSSGSFAEVARAVTNQDPYGKYPKRGICYIVGCDERQLGEVIFNRLFESAFDIVRNPDGTLRPFNPKTDPKGTGEPGPPWIPKRLIIGDHAWRRSNQRIPSKTYLKTGWEIRYYSGEGDPPRGSLLDLCLFDEEIRNHQWYGETMARLIKRGGRFIWDATPQTGTEQLYELYCQAEEPENDIAVFNFNISQNVFLGDKERAEFIAQCPEHERIFRVEGKFIVLGRRMFPEFGDIHLIPAEPVPHQWSRFIAIDPGFGKAGALLMAVPEPDENKKDGADWGICYDELFVENMTIRAFAEQMMHKMRDQQFLTFIMDMQHGRKRSEVNGKTIAQQLEEAFAELGLRSQLSGFGCEPANPDIDGGISQIRSWLELRPGGTPRLQIMGDRCPQLVKQLRTYSRHTVGGEVQDAPQKRGKTELVDCVRYLCQYNPVWIQPQRPESHYKVGRLVDKLKNKDSDHFYMGV